jgi:hypothetical protein
MHPLPTRRTEASSMHETYHAIDENVSSWPIIAGSTG